MNEDLNLVLTIDPDTKEMQEALAKMGDLLDANADIAQKDVVKALDAQRAQLEKINALMDPKFLKERVKLSLELVKAQEELTKLEEKEAREQSRPGFFQKLFQDPSKAMGDIGNNVSGFAGGIKDEYDKGGVGGIMDSISNALSKSGGGGGGISNLLGAVVGGAGGGGLGAAAGAVAGGPITLAITAAIEAMKAAGSAAAKPVEMVVGGLNLLGGTLNDLSGQLGPIGAGLNLISKSFSGMKEMLGDGALKEIFGPLLDAFAALPSAIKGVLETLTSFAAKANPAIFQMMGYAIDDVQAVIGRAFLPVLKMMVDGIRLFGDVLANLLPNEQEVSQALTELRQAMAAFGASIRDLVVAIGPTVRAALLTVIETLGAMTAFVVENIDVIASVFIGLGVALSVVLLPPLLTITAAVVSLGVAMAVVMAPFLAVIGLISLVVYALVKLAGGLKGIASLLGLSGGGSGRSSVGAAARNAQFQDADSYQRQLQQTAYSQPANSMAQVPSHVSSIDSTLTSIQRELGRFFARQLVRVVPTPPVAM